MPEFCTWTHIGRDRYETSCGKHHSFEEGGPLTALFVYCPFCASVLRELNDADPEEDEPRTARKLTRQEQLEALADLGIDTWEDYRGER